MFYRNLHAWLVYHRTSQPSVTAWPCPLIYPNRCSESVRPTSRRQQAVFTSFGF